MEPFTMYNDPSSSAYQSFPEFTLKPDITHFQRDQFNLRLLTDDSSLLWDSSKPSQLGIYDDGVSQVVKTERDQPQHLPNDVNKSKAKTAHNSRNSLIDKQQQHKRIISQKRAPTSNIDGRGQAAESKELSKTNNGPSPALKHSGSHQVASTPKQPDTGNESKDLSIDFDSVISLRRDTLNADLQQIQSSRQVSEGMSQLVQSAADDQMPKQAPEQLQLAFKTKYNKNEKQDEQSTSQANSKLKALMEIVQGPESSDDNLKAAIPKPRRSRSNSRENGKKPKPVKSSAQQNLEVPQESEEEKAIMSQLSVLDEKLSIAHQQSSNILSDKYLEACEASKQYATLGCSDANHFQVQNQIEQKLEHGYRKIEKLEKVKQPIAARESAAEANNAMPEEDDVKFLEMSLSYFRKKLRTKALAILWQNMHTSKTNRKQANKADTFRRRWLIQDSLYKLVYYVKVVLPAEKAMAVAYKQFLILQKIKVVRELRLYSTRKRRERLQLQHARSTLQENMKAKLFNIMLTYAAQGAIAKARLQQAFDHHSRALVRTTLASLSVYVLYSKNLREFQNKAHNYHLDYRLRQCLFALRQFSIDQRDRRASETISHGFKTQVTDPNIKLSVLIALHKFTQKSKNEKKAAKQHEFWTFKKTLLAFKSAILIQQNYQNQKGIAEEIYCQKLLQEYFDALVRNTHECKNKFEIRKMKLNRGLQRKVFHRWGKVAKQLKISEPMVNRMQVYCAMTMVRSSFHSLMTDVWREFPNQKLSRCEEVYQGRIDLQLPNYLQVSKSEKYHSFFFQTNRLLLVDLQIKALKSLKQNAFQSKTLKRAQRWRQKRQYFTAFKHQVLGQVLLAKYIERTDAVRNTILQRQVLQTLQHIAKQRAKSDNNFCIVLKARKLKLLDKHLNIWIQKYKTNTKRNQLERLSADFLRCRYINKYMAIWLRQLSHKLKKKHLKSIVLPQAQKQLVVFNHFRAWLNLSKKNAYLSSQLASIEQQQNFEGIQLCFSKLREYTRMRRQKHRKHQMAEEQYVYVLRKRVFLSFERYGWHQVHKKQLYASILDDHHRKRAAAIVAALQEYALARQERLISDVIIAKQIQMGYALRKFKRWHQVFERRQSLRFFEQYLDMARLRIGFQMIILHQKEDLVVQEKVKMKKEYYLQFQYFKALKALALKSKRTFKLYQIIQASSTPKFEQRILQLWQGALRKRQKQYQLFSWTILRIREQILKNYLKDLLAYARYRQLKRRSPQLYLASLVGKVFGRLKSHWANMRKYSSARAFLVKRKQAMTKHFVLSYWRFRLFQKLILIKRQGEHIQRQKQRIYNILRDYQLSKDATRRNQAALAKGLWTLKKQFALRKLKRLVEEKQASQDKMMIAEIFNNQFMYQQSFKAWVSYFSRNHIQIRKAIRIKEAKKFQTKRQFLKNWLRASSGPLQRLQAIKYIERITLRRNLKTRLAFWCAQVSFEIDLEGRIETFTNFRDSRSKQEALKTLRTNVSARQNSRDRLRELDAYYETKLANTALNNLKWYLGVRKDKKDKTSIAYARQAGTIIERSFIIFRYICNQQSQLRRAQYQFEEMRRQRYAPKLFRKLRTHALHTKIDRTKRQQAEAYWLHRTYGKVFRGLFVYCVKKAGDNMNNHKAYEFQVLTLQQTFFNALRRHAEDQRAQAQKQQMMYQVVQMIDSQNRMQVAYDALFQYLVQQTDDQHYAQEHLRFLKVRRIFKILEWNRDSNLQYKAAHDLIASKVSASQKFKYFFNWRTKFMQAKLISTYLENKNLNRMSEVFTFLSKNCYSEQQVKTFRQRLRLRTAKRCYVSLKQNIIMRNFKKTRLNLAEGHYNHSVEILALRSIHQHLIRQHNGKVIAAKRTKHQRRLGFRAWLHLSRHQAAVNEALCRVVHNKTVSIFQQSFRMWRKKVFLVKVCETLYHNLDMDYYQTEEYFTTVKEKALKSLILFKNRQKALQYKFLALQDKQHQQIEQVLFKLWRSAVKDQVFSMKLKKIIQPKIQSTFDALLRYAQKEHTLREIEHDHTTERDHMIKSHILNKWAAQLGRRDNISNFIRGKESYIMKKALMSIKEHLICKQENKLQQLKIIAHFSKRRPQNLHMFSKAFLLLSHEYPEEEAGSASRVGNLLLNYSDKMQSQYGSIEDTSQGVKMCQTVLAKYVVEKWKLSLPELRMRRRMKEQADKLFIGASLQKVFCNWRHATSIKSKKRALLDYGREYYSENLLKNAMEVLAEYKQKRHSKHQLSSVGQELLNIKQSQHQHRLLVTWYDLTLERIQHESRYDDIIQKFTYMQLEKKVSFIFFALKDSCLEQKAKRHIKLREEEQTRNDMEVYAQQFYERKILQMAINALRTAPATSGLHTDESY